MIKQPTKFRPYIKIHGGKFYQSEHIINNFPQDYQRMTYVEPFVGGGSVLLNKAISDREVANDIDPSIYAILLALKETPYEFISRLNNLKYSEETFEAAHDKRNSQFNRQIDYAINEYTLRRMSRGGLKQAFAWSDRQRGGRAGDENAWHTMLKMLPDISERMANVTLANEKAIDIIERYDAEDTLLYLDPPYLHTTRQAKQAYEFEMSEDDHRQLAERSRRFKGKVIISGYPSLLYNELFDGWRAAKKEIVNHASQQKVKQYKIEMLWMNY